MSFTKEEVLKLIEPIKIVKILSVEKHPNADRLVVTKVDMGSDEPRQVITGAPNVEVGQLVPFLDQGNVVPGYKIMKGEEIVLRPRDLRGIESTCMILAEDEIGLSEDHDGIMIISGDNSLIGKSIVEILSEDQINKIVNGGKVQVTADVQEKIDLITRDLAEVVGMDDLAALLSERDVKIYWGTATTGRPHLGYFVPMMKIADFLKSGAEVTILFADIHAYLDNMKSTWEVLEYRVKYYEMIIKEILTQVGVPIEKLKFVKGSDFELAKDYQLDVLKVSAMASLRDVQKAGAEVVKQVESPLMSSMLYPILQTIDEEYLKVDAQFGGVDQRKIFMFAREYLPKIGYKKRIHLMNSLIPGLGKSGKMSSSEPNSKVDFDDSDEIIKEKINKAFTVDGQIEGNGLLAILKYILFKKFESEGRSFLVEREEKWGGNVEYKTYQEVESDFASQKLSSVDLKPAIARELIALISPLREKINANQDLLEKAYPDL